MADGLPIGGIRLVAENAAGFARDINQSVAVVNNFSNSTTHAAGHTSGASQIMIGALRQVGTIAVDAFMRAGRAAVGFVSDSISAAGDFESGMNRFSAVAGQALQESGLSLQQFRDQFIQIGKELPVSTSEVQQAAIEMVKGGIEPATIAAGGLRQVIQFAAAADLDLEKASTIAAKALGGWVDQAADAKTKADFLVHSTDLLAKAANASTVNVDDLALGLYNVQGTAKLAGVSFDETVTALAQLAPSFSSSADAGTSFKAFLSRLQPSTKPAIAAMQGLGLYTEQAGSKFYDASGNFIGMKKASALLQDSLKGLTDAQRASILQTIFGQDAIRVAAVLSEQGATGYNNMAAALEKQNSVAEMARQKQQGFNTALDNAKGSMEALQITVGTKVLPILTGLLNSTIAPGINILTDLIETGRVTDQTFAGLSPTMQAVTTAMQGAFGAISGAIETAQGFIGRIIKDVEIWRSGVVGLPTILQSFGISPEAAGVIGSFVSGLEKLGTVFQDGGIKAAIPFVLENLARLREQLFQWVTNSLPGWLESLGQFAAPAGQWVLDAIPGLLANLGTFAQQMIEQTITYVPKWAATLLQFGIKAITWITDAGPSLTDNLGAFLNRMASWVVDSLPRWGGELAKLGDKAISWVTDALPGLGTNLGQMAGKLIGWIIDTAVDVTPKLAVLGGKFLLWVATDVLPKLPGVLLDIGTGIYNFISEVVKEVVPKLAKVGEKFLTWVETDVLPKLPRVLDDIKTGIGNWVTGAISWAGTELKGVGTAIVDGLKQGITDAWGLLVGWFQGKLEELRAMLPFSEPRDPNSPLRDLGSSGAAIITMLQEGMLSQARLLPQTIFSLGQRTRDSISDVLGQVVDVVQMSSLPTAATTLGEALMTNLSDGIFTGLEGVLTQIGEVGTEIEDALKRVLSGNANEVKGSSLDDFFGRRATGGEVGIGKAHWVGEQGKELFMPNQVGTILSHDLSMRMTAPPASAAQIMGGGGRGGTYNQQQTKVYQYSPTYAAAPRAPAVDFATMAAFSA